MRFPILAAGLCATAASARFTGLAAGDSNQAVLGDSKLSVPGDNPLEYCSKPEDWQLAIHSVDLEPNPPTAGTTLNFTASGIFSKDIEDGAKVHLTVKYGVITIINQVADLCETVKQVNLTCPLEKGPMTLTKSVDLPAQIPPGKYTVQADVKTKDDEQITCLKAAVRFERGSIF